jgi:hypothetical protein
MPLVRIPYKKTKSSKKTVKAYRKKVMPTTSKKVINKMIDKKISQNVENKVVGPCVLSGPVMSAKENSGSPLTLLHYYFAPASQISALLNIAQGTNQSQRIGNQIKLKRWIIKGTVCYEPKFSLSGNPVFNQATGYVDLYFGRMIDMKMPITSFQGLPNLYENGATTSTPSAQVLERTYRINKDYYKIYWHRRYKIGQSFDGTTTGTNNNDYKLSRDFGFDICKMVCKNKIIKYIDDSGSPPNEPQDTLVQSLTLFATFTQTGSNLQLGTGTDTHPCPATIYASSYVEYEDA